MTSHPSVSALVLTRNRPGIALKCLDSILDQSLKPSEIVVLENGSESSFSLAGTGSQLLRHCKIVSNPTNLGCPGGRNRLITFAQGELLLFVDDDGRLEKNAIKNALSHLSRHRDVGVITFRIIDPTTGAIRDGLSNRGPFYHHTFGGGSSIIRRCAIEKAGVFPEDFLRQGEEHDLALRILDAGFLILYAPNCVLFHGPTEAATSPTAWRNALVAPVVTAWRFMPLQYAVFRTVVNISRSLTYYQSGRVGADVWLELIRGIRLGLATRRPISTISYYRWRELYRAVKRMAH